jgi:hypothetical protein
MRLRSQCTCQCHTSKRKSRHIRSCCEPDPVVPFDWSQRVTDIKVTGMYARWCEKCEEMADPVVRITFLSEDKYVCKGCATTLTEAREFNPFFPQEL